MTSLSEKNGEWEEWIASVLLHALNEIQVSELAQKVASRPRTYRIFAVVGQVISPYCRAPCAHIAEDQMDISDRRLERCRVSGSSCRCKIFPICPYCRYMYSSFAIRRHEKIANAGGISTQLKWYRPKIVLWSAVPNAFGKNVEAGRVNW